MFALKPSGFSAASCVEFREFISTSFRVGHCAHFGVTSCEERKVVKIKVAMTIKRVNFSVLATTATELYLTITDVEEQTNLSLVAALLTYRFNLDSLSLRHDRNTGLMSFSVETP